MSNEKIISYWKQKLANAKSKAEQKIAEERLKFYDVHCEAELPEIENEIPIANENENKVQNPALNYEQLLAEKARLEKLAKKHPEISEHLKAVEEQLELAKKLQGWTKTVTNGNVIEIYEQTGEVTRVTAGFSDYDNHLQEFRIKAKMDAMLNDEFKRLGCHTFKTPEELFSARETLDLNFSVYSSEYKELKQQLSKLNREVEC